MKYFLYFYSFTKQIQPMIGISIFFVILGLAIKNGKLYFLMAGFNTLPEEEKKKYDVEGIASVFRNAMFFLGFVISLGYYISQWSEIPEIKFYSFYAALLVGIPYLLINSNKNKYKLD